MRTKWMTAGAVLITAIGGAAGCCANSCLAEGTLVATPDGPRAIESLVAGDAVLVVDPRTRELYTRKIVTVMRHELRETLVIDAGSSHMRVTAEHPVWVVNRDAWIEAGNIVVGDVLCVLEHGRVRDRGVEALRRDETCVTVFDLSLDGPEHTFFADGVLVHNKDFANPVSCEPSSPYYLGESSCLRPDGGALDGSDRLPADARVDSPADSLSDADVTGSADAGPSG